MRRYGPLLAGVVPLLLSTVTASAQTQGFYVGIGGGRTDWNASLETFDDGTLTGGQVNPKDDGWKLFGGYRFSRYFSVEGGFADLGQITFFGNSEGCASEEDCFFFNPGPVTLSQEADGFYGMAVGSFAIGRFDLFAKLGFFDLSLDLRLEDSGGTFTNDLESTETVWGAGVEYRFGGPAVRVEWERITNVPEEAVDFFSASLIYRFGEP